MSVIMEQQGTSTSTVTNVQIPGVPSDASVLNSLRNVFRRNDFQKGHTSTFKARTTEVRGTVDHMAISSAERRSKALNAKKSASADTKSKSPTIERQVNVAPAELSATQSKANTQQSLSIRNGIGAHPAPELITKNDRIRRILERVNWTKLRGDTVQEVATFRELEDAETKFQEFESFIRAEGKYLGLPEGCKPFERILIHGSAAGSKPCPYIRFTNFRTEEDVRKYHAVLSKRKVRHQYHPPLRLCYEIQRLRYHAAKAGTYAEGDPGTTLCGKTAVIEDGDTRRLVTIGGVIQVGNKLYAMTAGHSATAADEMRSTSETESPSHSSNDFEYDDDLESALICGGPSTKSDAEWQPHRGGQNDQHQNTPESAALTFHGSSMSGDDWSLHLINDPLLALPNALPGMDNFTTRYMTYPASQPFPGLVWLIAGVSGPLAVLMLPGVVSMPLPSGNWVSAWKIALNRIPAPVSSSHPPLALQRGDSGSWVVDCTNGNVFGHVIASTDTTAFLIPLIHTLDSISRQARLEGTKEIVSLPPAFDMLADLAHMYHNKPGKRNHDHARLLASRALMSSTKIQSPASEVAPIIDSFLESHGNSSTIRTIAQNLLVWTGANLKGNLAPMYRDENSEILSKVMDDSAPIERGVVKAAIRDLTIALGNSPDFLGIHETPWGRGPLLPGGGKPESKEQSNHNEPGSQSSLVYNMSGALRHSINDVVNRNDRLLEPMPEVVPSVHRSHTPFQDDKLGPMHLKKGRGRMTPVAWAGLASTIAVLIAAIGILGAFLGVKIQQNTSLQADLSKLTDAVPSCQTTTFTSTISATGTASAVVATSTTTDTTSNSGLSTGAQAGVGISVAFGILSCIAFSCWWVVRRRQYQNKASLSRSNPVASPKPKIWRSTTVGYSNPLAHPTELPESATEPPLETGQSPYLTIP